MILIEPDEVFILDFVQPWKQKTDLRSELLLLYLSVNNSNTCWIVLFFITTCFFNVIYFMSLSSKVLTLHASSYLII